MADVVFNAMYVNLWKAQFNWLSDDIRCALMSDSFTPDKDTMETWADVSGEIPATGGSTAGGKSLTGKTLDKDNTNDLVKLGANNPLWDLLMASNVRYALYYKWATLAADRLLLWAKDFGSNQNPNNVPFVVQHDAAGVSRTREYQAP